jgi:spermidine synthase
LRTSIAALLSVLAGYISLSQEILWFRLISYATGGSPFAFAHLLGGFLLGLAIGALAATALSKTTDHPPGVTLAILFLVSGLVAFFTVPATASVFTLIGESARYYSYFAVALVALPSGLIFPLLCHYAVDSFGAVGFSMSWLYLCNVVGASLAPIATTFILMDILPFASIVAIVSSACFAAATLSLVALPAPRLARAFVLTALLVSAVSVAESKSPLYAMLFEKLHFKQEMSPAQPYRILNESRSGVVAVGGVEGDDVIYGGGIYDGGFNLDPVRSSNGIWRAYMVGSLHRNPASVLEIGLSSGSWTRVLASHPAIRELTVVEINPAYTSIIKGYPLQSAILSDPKIAIHIDDGRRWLNRNPQRKFDLIVMNTTFHWRSHSTQLLSQEFLRICQSHLNQGGVVYLNTTGSSDVRSTVARTFRHSVAVGNFVAASDAPFDMTVDERRRGMLAFELPWISGSERQSAVRETLSGLARQPLVDESAAFRARTDLTLVTDDNMATEFKSDWVFLDSGRSWRNVIARLFRADT